MRPATLPAKTEIKQAFDEMVQDNILDGQEEPIEDFELQYDFKEHPDDDDGSDKLFAMEEWEEYWGPNEGEPGLVEYDDL